MKFENAFEVDAPVDRVWATVLDVEQIAPTVPGAKVLEQTAENAYKVGIKVKLGPMTMQYKADIEIVEADESSHRAVMKARAKESRGQGTADADVVMELTGDAEHTTGKIVTEVKVSGKAASMGRGVMQDVAGRMVGTFADNLAAMLSDGGAEEAAKAEAKASTNGAEAPEARPGTPEGEGPREGTEDPKERVEQAAASGGATKSDDADALDLGSLGGAMAAERLKDPLVIALLILAFLVGRRSAR
ncbi:MAG TPA: SRPBCC family protein [Solirubrobacteraceae bacterium]|nr:SRPBCC family protein [Solirubrobacteraceae bacterium]